MSMHVRRSACGALGSVVIALSLFVAAPARADDVTSVVGPGQQPVGVTRAAGDFWVAPDGSVDTTAPWGNRGGLATSDPDRSLWSILPWPELGSDYVFVRGTDGALWYTMDPGRGGIGLGSWTSLGGSITRTGGKRHPRAGPSG
jgi:hypothetical protein